MMTVAKSVYKLSRVLPTITIAMTLGKLHGYFTQMSIEMSGYAATEFRIKLQDDLMLGLFLHYFMCKAYLDLRKDGVLDIKAIRYEDLISDPLSSCRAILHHCNLPEELAELAVKGMELDSQRNSPIAKHILDKFNRDLPLSPHTREFVNDLLRKNDMPLIGEDSLLPGTITYQKSHEN